MRPNSSPATVSSPRSGHGRRRAAVHQRRADDLWSGSAHPPGRQSGDRETFRASGFEPEGYTLYAYASIQAIAAAWNAVGTDNAKASDWLKSHDVETVMGKKAWDGKGDLRCPTTWSISGTTRANITSSDRPRPEDALSFDLRIVT